MDEGIEEQMDPYFAQVFWNELGTDWKYVETLYQAFKQRMILEMAREGQG